ncbi:hypothetical protein OVS_03595 [Mycoplasma ovis str. Michigan]|uniref:Uncharacterized protein n=1 Tax=Mycoplasma ovis str. Michigan TaxID=1415773 RepID=A0ABN4BNM3_9MOLU|nr:hypothetical protein [Mycoplasma ovis]AHC40467.1 hypothetical protein OVS_03595 [Mycoplasma ovis str. Michigan]
MFLTLKGVLLGSSVAFSSAIPATLLTQTSLGKSVETKNESRGGEYRTSDDSDSSAKSSNLLSGKSEDMQKLNHFPPSTQNNLSEAQKYKNRVDNPSLCKDVLSSTSDKTKVEVCRDFLGKEGVEFMYHTDQIGIMPIRVANLQYTYKDFVVNFTRPDNYGMTNRRMTLSDDIISGKGIIPLSSVGGKQFTDKHCKAVGNLAISSINWTISCQIT